MITASVLCGLDHTHITWGEQRQRLQAEAGAAFTAMQQAAVKDGHDLQIASGFRDYTRQAAIWQRKTEHIAVTDESALHNILHWSAMPGASRHHWGTDMDVYDPVALGDARLQLVPQEYAASGPLGPLYQWLRKHAAEYGFFWPYDIDRGGVAVEPWHLSYAPLAEQYLQAFNADTLLRAWQQHRPTHHDWLAHNVDALIERYVLNINQKFG